MLGAQFAREKEASVITEAEFKAIKTKMDAGELPEPSELAAMEEYAIAQAKAALAANPVHIVCKHCGAENVVAAIDDIVVCEWCDQPLLMDTLPIVETQDGRLGQED